ncbi:MAG TPA: hypothetical protein PKI19_02015 [Elusimicrobiales bacterium]|nr:hypothetical protein [Elusimicrobiales bacterium]
MRGLVLFSLLFPAGAYAAPPASSLDGLTGLAGAQAPAPPPPPGSYKAIVQTEVPVEACPAYFGAKAAEATARLNAKTQEAVQMVESALPALNKALARKILLKIKAKKIRVLCGESSGLDGGKTEHEAGGAVNITMYLKAGGSQYPLADRIFHEFIHAADPDGKLILSAAMHARAGFPDPVYGCQFGVFRNIGTDEIDRLGNYERSQGLTIPELDSYACAGRDCAQLRKYAYLCSTGKPLAGAATLDKAAEQKGAACVMDGILNNCELAACSGFRAKVDEEMERSGGSLTAELGGRLKAAGARLYRAALAEKKPSQLEQPEDRPLYIAAFKAGFLKKTGPGSCLK